MKLFITRGLVFISALVMLAGVAQAAGQETVDKDVIVLDNGNIMTMNPKQAVLSTAADTKTRREQ